MKNANAFPTSNTFTFTDDSLQFFSFAHVHIHHGKMYNFSVASQSRDAVDGTKKWFIDSSY